MPHDLPRTRPPALLAVVVAVGLEALALVFAAGAGLVSAVRGAQDVGATWGLVVLAALAALLLAQAARGLWQGRRWGRGPVLTAQILLVVVAWTWWGVGGSVPALLVAALGVLVGVGVLLPSVVRATTRTGPDGPPSPPAG